jgi:hypothetical protein
MYKCSKCENIEFDNYTSLSRHMGRTHHIDTGQTYVDYYLNGVWPLCKCGCGEQMKWSYQLKGFRDYTAGHQSRVHNNWGNNPDALQKSLDTRRERFASGEISVWNKGLTVNDPRVKDNIKKTTLAINSDPEELKRRSELMSLQRKDGTIPDLHGPEHSQWKGGASSINVLVRARVKLYKEWKYPILIRDGFKCIECGKNGNLHVHHNKEQMAEIIQKHLVDDMNPKTFEEKEMIADAVVDYHINNHVSGVTLCGVCHNKIHPSLNFG